MAQSERQRRWVCNTRSARYLHCHCVGCRRSRRVPCAELCVDSGKLAWHGAFLCVAVNKRDDIPCVPCQMKIKPPKQTTKLWFHALCPRPSARQLLLWALRRLSQSYVLSCRWFLHIPVPFQTQHPLLVLPDDIISSPSGTCIQVRLFMGLWLGHCGVGFHSGKREFQCWSCGGFASAFENSSLQLLD